MPDQTEGSIRIAADAATVMATINDLETYPQWSGEIKQVEVLDRDAQGRPSRARFEVSAGPITARYVLAYEYAPEDRGVSWTFVEGSGISDLSGAYELRPDGDETEVTYRLRLDVSIPGPGFLKRRLMGEGEKRIIHTALNGLKDRVESAS